MPADQTPAQQQPQHRAGGLPHNEAGYLPRPGATLYYQVWGAGKPVVLVHGFAVDHRAWDWQLDALTSTYQVICYDLHGFGQSPLSNDTPYCHADDLLALLDHLHLPTATLGGLSMGGEVALDFALSHPKRCTSLLLIGPTIGGYQWSADWLVDARQLRRTAREQGETAARAQWLHYEPLFGPALTQPAVRAALEQMLVDYSFWHWRQRDPAIALQPPAITRLREIAAPTLLINGAADPPDFQAMAALLADQLPTIRAVQIPGVGHLANLEAPATCNRIMLDFLASLC